MPDEQAAKPSTRNLQDGFAGTPLRRFKGKYDGYTTEPATGYEGTRVLLNFASVEVLESTEPYNFPTATINIGQSNKKKSKWGYLGESLNKLQPPDEDIDDQQGKVWGMVYCDGQEGRPAPRPIWSRDADRTMYPDGEVPTPVWEVYELEGAASAAPGSGAVTPTDRAKELLDGNTLSDFNRKAFADTLVRKDPDLQRAITDKSFVKNLLDAGEFTKDENDLYHKAAPAAAAPA